MADDLFSGSDSVIIDSGGESPSGGYRGSDSFFSELGDVFMDSVDSVDLGEDGSIELGVRTREGVESDAPRDAEPESDAPQYTSEVFEKLRSESEFLTNQYKEVQGWATKVSQENAELRGMLAEMRESMNALRNPVSEADDEAALDPELAEQIERVVGASLDKLLGNKLGVQPEKLQAMTVEFDTMAELRQAVAKNEDFMDYFPLIKEYYSKNPDSTLSFQQSYDLVKAFYNLAPEDAEVSTEGHAAPESPAPQGPTQSAAQPPQREAVQESHEHLQERARRLQTMQGVNRDGGFEAPEQTINTPLEAAMQALREMGVE